MGVPTFYRWLSSRYPRVLLDVKDDLNERDVDMADEETFAFALLSPNPNGEFDNLYIDMNGLIHPCCHPEGLTQPPSEEVMFQCIFDYIDRLFYLVRPRKLLYLAIDGVAPRAKMNQQRSRRFKAAAEADLEAEIFEKVAQEFSKKNVTVPPKEQKWDSNVITPGTPFMHELSKRIVTYVEHRRRIYESWARIHVIFSDANTPGEGEHKIMNFIRNQRHSPEYDPNTRHVLHGMDADLIMLGLATHEVNFYIIREIVSITPHSKNSEKEIRQSMLDAQAKVQQGLTNLKSDKSYRSMLRQNWKNLQFIRLPVLREYLSHQFSFPSGWASGKGKIDFERCIDDLVLMCFFCGNDFLPHLPSISIPGGSIDQMILLYQNILPDLGDYLSNEGELNLDQCHEFVSYIARVEDQVFKAEQDYKQRRKARQQHNDNQQATSAREFPNKPGTNSAIEDTNYGAEASAAEGTESSSLNFDIDEEFKKRVTELLKEQREIDELVEPIDLSLNDPQLWKSAYYKCKFELSEEDDVAEVARNVATHYIKGMCWVLKYYYQGCASWGWYYPFHYAPFCSDLDFRGLEFTFEYGKPFTPFQQLMSVMPIRSSHCLPAELRVLMNDTDSLIASYYPTKFREDPNGKKYRYQWIALLPFIDERTLLNIVQPIEAKLAEEFQERNSVKKERLYVGRGGIKTFVGDVTEADGYHELVSRTEKAHQSRLLDGAQPPTSVLRIEDLMEEGRNRGFNCDAAKRMISAVISRGNRTDDSHGDKRGSEVLGNFNRDFHQTHNQYNPCPNMDTRQKRNDPQGNQSGHYRGNRNNDNRGHGQNDKRRNQSTNDSYRGGTKIQKMGPQQSKQRAAYSPGGQNPRHGAKRYNNNASQSRPNQHHDGRQRANKQNMVDPYASLSSKGPNPPIINYRSSSATYERERPPYRKPSPPPYRAKTYVPDGRNTGTQHQNRGPNRDPGGGKKARHDHQQRTMKSNQAGTKGSSIDSSKSQYLGGMKLNPPKRTSDGGSSGVQGTSNRSQPGEDPYRIT